MIDEVEVMLIALMTLPLLVVMIYQRQVIKNQQKTMNQLLKHQQKLNMIIRQTRK